MKATILFLLATGLVSAADFTGTITDSMCGKDHSSMKMGDDAKCTEACVKAGAKYALYDGKTVYALSDQAAAAKFAGRKVTVTGAADAAKGGITVAKIVAAK